jgi:RND family efflux transporter MFP subunit
MKTMLVLPLALGAAVAAAGCGSRAETAPTPRPGVPVRTAKVEARDLDDTLSLSGTLRPRRQVQVVAEVSARLLSVLKDEGARVAAGETLALLDDVDYRLAHERAQAALAVAEANRRHALTERERADNLLKTGGITDKDHLAAQVNLQVAEASLAQAKAETAIAAQQLARARVTAPFAGRVARRLADAGTMLASGTPLYTLVDDGVLEFRAAVPSADYGKLRLGAPVALSVDALGGRRAEGRVARITPLVDERTRAFELVVEVPGDGELVGGLFARAQVRVGQVKGARVVPPAALVRDGSDARRAEAFVIVGGKAERRTVSVGVETPQAIQVTQGLEPGDVVVVDPPVALASGAPVDVQNGRR